MKPQSSAVWCSHAHPAPPISVCSAVPVCGLQQHCASCLGLLLGQLWHCHKCRFIKVWTIWQHHAVLIISSVFSSTNWKILKVKSVKLQVYNGLMALSGCCISKCACAGNLKFSAVKSKFLLVFYVIGQNKLLVLTGFTSLMWKLLL